LLAWLIWLFIHLMYLVQFSNRLPATYAEANLTRLALFITRQKYTDPDPHTGLLRSMSQR
jgi:hypothetical protein